MEQKDIIDITGQDFYDAKSFREAAEDCLLLIFDILRMGDEMSPREIANRAYFLHWLVADVEVIQSQRFSNSTTHKQ